MQKGPPAPKITLFTQYLEYILHIDLCGWVLEHEEFSRTIYLKPKAHVLLVPNTIFQLIYGARPDWAHLDEEEA